MGEIKLNVVHIGEYVKGGVATHLRDVLKFQQEFPEIDKISLILSSYNSETQFPIKNDNIFAYPYKRGIFHIVKSMIEIKKLIKKLDPDIVHVHSTFAGLMVRFPLLFDIRRPIVIYNPHGWAFNMDISKKKKYFYALVERLLSLKTDKIINISDNEEESALNYKFSSKKLETLYNGIELQKTNRDCKELPLTINKNKINILFIGRYDKQKGLDILLSFFAKLKQNTITLYLIGGTVLDDTSIKIPNNVVNIGWVDNNCIDSYMQLFDAVIIPSRWEGFGLVALEGMRNKKAIIVSNRGALPELVKHGVNGYIFDLNNLSTLEEIFKNLNKKTLKTLGENGFDIFEKYFTSDKMNQQIIKLYKDVLL